MMTIMMKVTVTMMMTMSRHFYNKNSSTIFCGFWRLLKRLGKQKKKEKKKKEKEEGKSKSIFLKKKSKKVKV